ncbi:hypothetical protein GGF31_003956 [Allomyces arbusculus]|nr:hypothetical protein GGF31_003956 [Allomyces arbusculus]
MDPTAAAAAPAHTSAPSLSLEARRVALRLQALHAELDVIEPVVTRLAQTVRALAPLEPVLARLATLAASTAAAAAAPDPAPAPSAMVAPAAPIPAATEPAPATVPPPLFAPTTGPARTRSIQVNVSPPPPPPLSRTLPDLHPPLVPARRTTRRSTTFPATEATATTTPVPHDPGPSAATTTTKVTATPTSATTRRGRAPPTNDSRPPARRSLPYQPADGTSSVGKTTVTATTTRRPRAPSVSMACRRPPPRVVETIAPPSPGTNEPFFLDAAAYFAGDPHATSGAALQAAVPLPSPPSSQRTGAGKKRARGEVVDARHASRGKRARWTATTCMMASQPATAVDDEDDGFALLFGGTQP